MMSTSAWERLTDPGVTAPLADRRPRGSRAVRCADCRRALLDEQRLPRGRQARCPDCQKAFDAGPAAGSSGSARDRRLRRAFNLTEEQLALLIAAQGGTCALCRNRPPTAVDHDHATGAVRGVLCPGCKRVPDPRSRRGRW
ncbi:endonuclease domain-containing protein [Streptomyces sp. NPDC001156]